MVGGLCFHRCLPFCPQGGDWSEGVSHFTIFFKREENWRPPYRNMVNPTGVHTCKEHSLHHKAKSQWKQDWTDNNLSVKCVCALFLRCLPFLTTTRTTTVYYTVTTAPKLLRQKPHWINTCISMWKPKVLFARNVDGDSRSTAVYYNTRLRTKPKLVSSVNEETVTNHLRTGVTSPDMKAPMTTTGSFVLSVHTRTRISEIEILIYEPMMTVETNAIVVTNAGRGCASVRR